MRENTFKKNKFLTSNKFYKMQRKTSLIIGYLLGQGLSYEDEKLQAHGA